MKQNIVRWLSGFGLGLALGGAAILTQGCAGTVAYTGGAYGAYYDYDYYPDWNVYYYPAGGIYHWNEGGHWTSGRYLPRNYVIGHSHHERLRYHTQQPWTEHGEHH